MVMVNPVIGQLDMCNDPYNCDNFQVHLTVLTPD